MTKKKYSFKPYRRKKRKKNPRIQESQKAFNWPQFEQSKQTFRVVCDEIPPPPPCNVIYKKI